MPDMDSDLQAQARAGDAAAFGQLIRRWDNDLRGVVWSVVRSATHTDDVMQQSYEKAFRSIGSFDGRSSMKTWLHSICYRTAIDHVRYEGRRRHRDIDDLGDAGGSVRDVDGGWPAMATVPNAEAPDDRVIASIELSEVLDQLDADQRVVLMLTAGLGYSFEETAEIVGMKRGTVASKAGRARKLLSRWEQS